MKVRITPEMKKHLTLDMMPEIRKIIEEMKEISKEEFMEDCERIVQLASRGNESFEILKAEAEICNSCWADGFFSEKYPNLDVCIKVYAYNKFEGFYEVHACLSSFWQLAGDTNAEEIRNLMYISSDETRRKWKRN